MAETDEKLSRMAGRLKLSYMRDNMSELLRQAMDARMNPRETLEFLFARETDQREANRIKMSLMSAHLPVVKTFDEFDYTSIPALDPGKIRELRTLDWIEKGENLLLMGPPGVGKTHLALAFAREAVIQGKSVLFLSAARLIELLMDAQKKGMLKEKLTALTKPKLLVIDELGYLPVSQEICPLFYEIVNRRYERKSIIVTSNRPVSQWGSILGDPTGTTAIVDRLVHHCETLMINGESYRVKQSKLKKLMGNNQESIASDVGAIENTTAA